MTETLKVLDEIIKPVDTKDDLLIQNIQENVQNIKDLENNKEKQSNLNHLVKEEHTEVIKNPNNENENENINSDQDLPNNQNLNHLENMTSSTTTSPVVEKEINEIINNECSDNKEEKPKKKESSKEKNSEKEINSNMNSPSKQSKKESKEIQEKKSETKTEKKKIKKKQNTTNNKNKDNDNNKSNNIKNILNNKNISESVYCQFNSLYLNKQFIKKNNNNSNSIIRRKQGNIHKNKNRSIDDKYNKNDKLSETQRLDNDQKKKKEKITELKKENEEKEKNAHKPIMNKKSQEIVSKNKEDFYSRQRKLIEDKKKKNALLKEKLEKKEIEEINKNNILLMHQKERKKRNRQKSMDEAVKTMYEWEEKRKQKLKNKIETKEKIITKDLKQKPKINKNSYLITVNRKPDKIFNRLYDDVIRRKQKQEMLEQVYAPTFRPNLMPVKSPKKRNFHSNINIKKDKEKYLRTISVNSARDNYRTIKDESENEELEDHDEEEVCDVIRSHVLNKINKKRFNTTENLKSKKLESRENCDLKDQILNNDNNDVEKQRKVFFSPKPFKKSNNKIKIKKNYGFLLSQNKNRNRNRSGFL